jgi:DNA-binding transcriptional LysR family regulator
MSDLITLFRTFARVAEAGSFTSVAVERNTSQPTISRQIAALEAHLGCLLFQRTTRSLTLTDDGRVLYDHALRSLEALNEAEGAVGRRKGKPSGTLRLACAVVFGRLHVVPRLPRFLARYPDLSVDLVMHDGFTDLIEEGIDLAIRVGDIRDPGLIARRIGTTRRVVVATPDYLARRDAPRVPQDLSGHDCIVYARLATGSNWTFATPDGTIHVPISGRLRVNSTEGLRAAVLAGIGIAYVPVWHFVEQEIETGRLVRLLPDHEPRPQPISAVYPSRRYLSPKVRTMIDYLAAEFALDANLSSSST